MVIRPPGDIPGSVVTEMSSLDAQREISESSPNKFGDSSVKLPCLSSCTSCITWLEFNEKFRNPNVTHSPVFASIFGLYCPFTVCIKFSVVSAAT